MKSNRYFDKHFRGNILVEQMMEVSLDKFDKVLDRPHIAKIEVVDLS
jgi:hypothetical protein